MDERASPAFLVLVRRLVQIGYDKGADWGELSYTLQLGRGMARLARFYGPSMRVSSLTMIHGASEVTSGLG